MKKNLNDFRFCIVASYDEFEKIIFFERKKKGEKKRRFSKKFDDASRVATIESIVSLENFWAEDQPNTEVFVAYVKIKRFLFIRFTTVCSGDGFDRTPVSIQTNWVLRLLFQSIASLYELYISVPITYSIGVLHSIDYFRELPKRFLRIVAISRCNFLFFYFFFLLRFYFQRSPHFLNFMEIR